MRNVLPQQAGLQVSSVAYQYTTIKNIEDPMLVHVQNENARGDGYIFRSTDDWSGIPGNSINKIIPVNLIDISYWGDGSIEVEGFGTVTDAKVFYTYQYDPCFDPQSNPECPGYVDPFVVELTEIEVEDPLDNDYVQDELDRKANLRQQKEDEKEEARKKALEKVEEIEQRLEQLLGIAMENEFSVDSMILHQAMMGLNSIPQSYLKTLVGGSYDDTVVLVDSKLPTNPRSLRVGMAQELLHQKLVDLQYAK